MDQNNVIILGTVVCLDDFIIKLFQKHIILKLAAAKLQKKLLRSPGHLRIDRKFHIQYIFPDRTGKRLFKNVKIFKRLFFRQ